MYIVAYDITSTKFRNQIIKVLKTYGYRVQYSVFECDISSERLETLSDKLTKLFINSKNKQDTDNIQIYTVCKSCMKTKIHIGNPRETKKPDKENNTIVI